MEQTARILRVLEYTGPSEMLIKHLEQRHIKGTFVGQNGRVTIREAIVGEFPEILERSDDDR
jgi:hypothetical protein